MDAVLVAAVLAWAGAVPAWVISGRVTTPEGDPLSGVRVTIPEARRMTDSAGAFQHLLRLPATVAEGSYRLVAVAADGDEVASLDVTVLKAAEAAEHAGHDMMNEPTGEPLALERAKSPLVTAGALAGIGLALVAGVVLLRRPRHRSH